MNTHRPRKRFGQHFLQDPAILDRMMQVLSPSLSEDWIEIGPGQGALTQYLLNHVHHLDIIEIDRDLVAHCQTHFGHHSHLTIHSGDALSFDYRQCYRDRPLRIAGNLPYNISTPLLFHLVQFSDIVRDMYFLLQKEVVDRLTATPRSPNYGRLSVMMQYFCEARCLFLVPPTAFHPPPEVNSAFVYLRFHEKKLSVNDFSTFELTVKTAFNYRRKTIQNGLKGFLKTDDWLSLKIDPKSRPEELTIQDFISISNHIHAQKSTGTIEKRHELR